MTMRDVEILKKVLAQKKEPNMGVMKEEVEGVVASALRKNGLAGRVMSSKDVEFAIGCAQNADGSEFTAVQSLAMSGVWEAARERVAAKYGIEPDDLLPKKRSPFGA